jgi:hypothetical protein
LKGDHVAKQIRKKDAARRKQKVEAALPFEKINLQIIGIGIAVIVAGYIALAQGPLEGFLPLFVAPILLLLGYCVIVPVGILYRKKVAIRAESQHASQA